MTSGEHTGGSPPAASTLLVAAGIHTLSDRGASRGPVDSAGSGGGPVRAIAVRDSVITWVGRDVGDAPPCDQTIDLGGSWILPAFVDAHVHTTATGLAQQGLSLAAAPSLAACLDALRRHAEATAYDVLLGAGWEDFRWPEGRPPTATEVSAAAPGRTVLLERVDGHSCVVDAATLAQLNLASLEGVDRDAGGHATGWLKEQAGEAARRLVRERLSPQRLAGARLQGCRAAAALGIGTLHEMGHPGLSGLDDALAWAEGDWPLEVLVWWAELDAGAGPRHGLRSGGDLFLDGSIGSHTAAVTCRYDDGGHGELFHDDGAVAAFFLACSRAGRQAGVHAIGDRAIEQALMAIEAATAVVGVQEVRHCRHRIEHVELPSRGQLTRMAALGVVASVQPAFDATWGGAEGLYASRFGREVARDSNPLGWMADAGIQLAFGSDSTVTPLDPWGAVAAAESHHGGLSLDRWSAVAAHTLGGRYAGRQDDVGPLVPGSRCDLSVWDDDPFSVSDVRGLRCQATVVGGRTAWGDLPLASTVTAVE